MKNTQLRLNSLALAVSLTVSGVSQSATILVNSNLDNGSNCTLRDALTSFNAGEERRGCLNSGATSFGVDDRIEFDPSLNDSTIQLGSFLTGQLEVTSDVEIFAEAGSNISIQGGTSARIFKVSNAHLGITNMTLQRGTAPSDTTPRKGGAVYLNSASLTLRNSTVQDCASQASGGLGGVVFLDAGSALLIQNSTLSNNSAVGSGGVIAADTGASITIQDSTITGNFAANRGGVAHLDGASLMIHNSKIYDNYARTREGGAIYGKNESYVYIADSQLYSNTGKGGSEGNGGALSLVGSSSGKIKGGRFDQNEGRSGGAIHIDNSTLEITDQTSFNSNNGSYGGVIGVLNYGYVSVDSSTFHNNTAVSRGGSIYSGLNGNLVLLNSSISGGDAALGGAASTKNAGSISIVNSTISENTSAYGGALSARDSGSALVRNSTIRNNTAESLGGGVYIAYDAMVVVEQSTVHSNSALGNSPLQAGRGGAFALVHGGSLLLTNSTVAYNSAAASAGGILSSDSNFEIRNSTLFEDTSLNFSSSIGAGGGTSTITNSIIAGSDSDSATDCSIGGTLILDEFTLIRDGSCGASRDGDPGLLPLADNGGPTQTFLPKLDSPAVNTGDNTNCLIVDQRGEPRFAEEPNSCDIGSVEVSGERPTNFIVIPLTGGKVVVLPL